MQAQNAKQFAASIALRMLITKERFYRQPAAQRVAMLQSFADATTALYNEPDIIVNTPHVMDVLAAIRGLHWAHAVYALASPALYIKNIRPLDSRITLPGLYLPFVGAVEANTSEELIAKWGEVFTQYMQAQNGVTGLMSVANVGNAVAGNVAMSTLFNAAVDAGSAILVYDEDAVQAVPDEPIAAPVAEPVVEPAPAMDDEEAQFNATH